MSANRTKIEGFMSFAWELVKAELLAGVISVVTLLNGWAGWTYWQDPAAGVSDMPIRSSLPYIWLFVSLLCGLYWNFKICFFVYERIRRKNLTRDRMKRIALAKERRKEIENRPENQWASEAELYSVTNEIVITFLNQIQVQAVHVANYDTIEHIGSRAKVKLNSVKNILDTWKIKNPKTTFRRHNKDDIMKMLRSWDIFLSELYVLCVQKDLESARNLYDKMKQEKMIR